MADQVNQKKVDADHKRRYELHVMLICEQDRIPKSKAQFVAWLEGPGGLNNRMPSAPSSAPPAAK